MKDRVAVGETAIDPQGDRFELGTHAASLIGRPLDRSRSRAHDVAAPVADMRLSGNFEESRGRNPGIIFRVERALVEIMPGQVAALFSEIAPVEGSVEPPGRSGLGPE